MPVFCHYLDIEDLIMPLPSMCRILDNLPLVVPIKRVDQDSTVYQLGFHVGLKGQYGGSKEEKFFIHSHLAFTVKHHRDSLTESARIVDFEVKPFSVKQEYEGK
ncbi:putative nonaspanin (TM9SF) [Medicago truncatula]|uniref:Putative nonaspanin (TM9SF) n=1 Tax=Medicago truncatula TaxID=3880 RepID=A0A396HR83_MEDTR|nr:putative nonaspanin (TM9SF) [Medicago truncatula]